MCLFVTHYKCLTEALYKLLSNACFIFFSEDKTKYPATFEEELETVAREKFAWKPTDNVEKKIAECIKQLRDTLEKRRLVGISYMLLNITAQIQQMTN